MRNESRFLRPDVIVEPLVDGFYASLLTVAPVQAAMNLAFLHVPLLESYMQSPQVHILGSRNPQLRGGFFVNIDEGRSGEVRSLLALIRRERVGMLRFAEAIAEAEDRQSVQLSLETGAERPFVLSTPRLPSPGVLDLRVPFRHPGLEELFRARIQATTLARLRAALDLGDDEAAQLDGLLTAEPDLAEDRHIDSGGRIRYFGHACLVMQTPEAAIITDPWLSADSTATGRYTYRDLPDHIDLALITHGHQDHVVLETLLQLRGRVDAVVVPRCSRGNL